MAIKIPSKHIYAKENQKVVDNEVDYIEVHIKVPQIVNATENVYNVSYNNGFFETEKQKDLQSESYSQATGTFSETSLAVAYVEEIPKYVTKTISIPKNYDNTYVFNLLTGLNRSGNANINLSLRGNIEKGNLVGNIFVKTASSNQNIFGELNFNKSNILETQSETLYSLTDKEKSISYNADAGLAYMYVSTTASLVLSSIDNVITASAKDNGNNFEITLTILCGLRINKLKGGTLVNDLVIRNSNLSLSGEYEEYNPTEIGISFYGDTIKLDLEDNVISIGGGDNIMSFNGNELIQKTNVPTIEETYKKVIKNWAWGKELATLRCGIEDYYEEEKNFTINVVNIQERDYLYVTISSNASIGIGNILYLENKTQLTVISKLSNTQYYCTAPLKSEIQLGEQTATILGKKVISNSRENNLPMTFHIGDIVIPYVYGANHNDKPMSLNRNGTPKEFTVVGKKMIYDGAIWQELSLQEVTKEKLLPYEVVIEVTNIEEYEQDARIDFRVIEGTLKAGDSISYEGRTALVYLGADSYYTFASLGSPFYNALGKTITVNKVSK